MNREEMRAHITSAPKPMDGTPITHRDLDLKAGYDLAGRALAHAMLLWIEESPDRAGTTPTYTELEARWPGLDRWLGGVSGFQTSWAEVNVRWILEVR